MALFGLSCEGKTDQAVIENILCGYFDKIHDLDDDIIHLQPSLDATDNAALGLGGWTRLLSYLSSSRFREDILNTRYLIIQIDTDIASQKNFDVSFYDLNNNELPIESLIDKVIKRLISEINKGDIDFYNQYHQKIIFCISVHSIECWLLAHYNNNPPKNPKTKNCDQKLDVCLKKKNKSITKTYRSYETLSAPFLKKKNLIRLQKIESSFNVFLKKLKNKLYKE